MAAARSQTGRVRRKLCRRSVVADWDLARSVRDGDGPGRRTLPDLAAHHRAAMSADSLFDPNRGCGVRFRRVAMVSVAQVAANRMRLAQLLATNGFGRNLPAIAETEDQYQDMWVNNSAAMSRYQATSAHATALPGFASPPR
ncbi:PPE family protein [Mycobacterium xenopi 4042]|uniref:PPE family protein n=1 Tax=Mycobacterium xenopi 4042 TaxID=1299334 RepID=X7YL25_MYCXE|nr:PPE family protein [Mycobacterium xenopi 4042]